MLKILRKKGVAKKILIGLAIVIVPAFVLWGSAGLIKERRGANYAGIMFAKKIGFDQYANAFSACKNQAIMRYGDDFYKLQRFLNLNAETWDRLILLHEANRRKIKATDAEVFQRISEFTFFQKDSKFNKDFYNQILEYVFRTPAREFEEEIRQQIMLEKLYAALTKDISVGDEEVIEKYKQENEKVKVEFIQILPESFLNQVSVSDEEIDAYYQGNQEQLRKPPSVNVQYIGKEYAQDASDEDKAKILSEMNGLSEKIQRPEDLEKISESEGLPIMETGFFTVEGPIPGVGWSYPFIQTAFNLKPNQVSSPVETPKGYFILKLKDRKDSYIPQIDEAKEKISETLKNDKAKSLAEKKAKEYLQYILDIHRSNPKAVNFAKLAQGWNTKTDTTPLFNREDYIPNVGKAKDFNDAAFSLKDKKEPFDIVNTMTGSFIIRLEEYLPIDQSKFTEQKVEFTNKVLNNKKNEYFNNFFEGLRNESKLIDNIGPASSKNLS